MIRVDSVTLDDGTEIVSYYREYAASDITNVTVSLPLENAVTGGGYIVNSDSAGLYAGDDGLRTNFGFNVKTNKKRNTFFFFAFDPLLHCDHFIQK